MRRRSVLLGGAGLLLSGCVPDRYSFFRPDAPSGVLSPTHGTCNDVPDAITLRSKNGGGYIVRLRASGPDETRIRVSIEIGQGNIHPEKSFWFDPKADKDISERRVQEHSFAFADDKVWVTLPHGERAAYRLEFPGGSSTFSAWAYQYGIVVKKQVGDWFDLELPPFSIDGVSFQVPAARFTPATVTAMTGINC